MTPDHKNLNVLWIEDGALFELAHLAGPVYADDRYDLFIASDVTTGLQLLMEREYEAVIVDIRLPPGEDRVWDELYKKAGSHKSTAGLGLKLLQTILGAENAPVKLESIPSWLSPEKIGVFSVERYVDLQPSLEQLGITLFRQKTADMPGTALLDLITAASNAKH